MFIAWIVVIAVLIFFAFGFAGLRVAALLTLSIVVIGVGLLVFHVATDMKYTDGPSASRQRDAVRDAAHEKAQALIKQREAEEAANPELKAQRLAEAAAARHKWDVDRCLSSGRIFAQELADRNLKIKLSRQQFEAGGTTWRQDDSTQAEFLRALSWSFSVDNAKMIERCTPLWIEGDKALADTIEKDLTTLRNRGSWDPSHTVQKSKA